ncbi:hypothetical protein AAG570_012241 [Ranatra chinensis]|uniref:Uncharacterized protein n=1 Tax=Ranatra chinensis TaxID=642074 RepID=A0ABD0YWP8_9HEMI
MASKRRNMFYKNKNLETTEIAWISVAVAVMDENTSRSEDDTGEELEDSSSSTATTAVGNLSSQGPVGDLLSDSLDVNFPLLFESQLVCCESANRTVAETCSDEQLKTGDDGLLELFQSIDSTLIRNRLKSKK